MLVLLWMFFLVLFVWFEPRSVCSWSLSMCQPQLHYMRWFCYLCFVSLFFCSFMNRTVVLILANFECNSDVIRFTVISISTPDCMEIRIRNSDLSFRFSFSGTLVTVESVQCWLESLNRSLVTFVPLWPSPHYTLSTTLWSSNLYFLL